MRSLESWDHPFTPQSLTGRYVRGEIELDELIRLVNERTWAKVTVDIPKQFTPRERRKYSWKSA